MKKTMDLLLVLVSVGCTVMDKGPKGEIISEEPRALAVDLSV